MRPNVVIIIVIVSSPGRARCIPLADPSLTQLQPHHPLPSPVLCYRFSPRHRADRSAYPSATGSQGGGSSAVLRTFSSGRPITRARLASSENRWRPTGGVYNCMISFMVLASRVQGEGGLHYPEAVPPCSARLNNVVGQQSQTFGLGTCFYAEARIDYYY